MKATSSLKLRVKKGHLPRKPNKENKYFA
jgi:hypothetical protein